MKPPTLQSEFFFFFSLFQHTIMKASSFNGFWILLLLFPVSLFLSSVSAFSPTGSIRHPVKFIIGSCFSFVVISEYGDGFCVDRGKFRT